MKRKIKVVFKKGRYVKTRKGADVIKIAKNIARGLKPLTYKQEIVGSIRRKSPSPIDIDIIVIPRSKKKIIQHLSRKGKYLQGGEKRVSFKIKDVKTEIYFATNKSWGAHLMTYTGPFQYNIGLRMKAKNNGLLLNQYGLFKKGNNKYLAGATELSIYKALGKHYKEPELRGK